MQLQQVNAQVNARMDKIEGMFVKFMKKSRKSGKRAKKRKARKIKRAKKVKKTLEHDEGVNEKIGLVDNNHFDYSSSSIDSSDSDSDESLDGSNSSK